jgi:hypothetical protein
LYWLSLFLFFFILSLSFYSVSFHKAYSYFLHIPHTVSSYAHFFFLGKQKLTMASNSAHTGAWHTFDCHGQIFTVPIRYQDPVFIGQGSLGIVV